MIFFLRNLKKECDLILEAPTEGLIAKEDNSWRIWVLNKRNQSFGGPKMNIRR